MPEAANASTRRIGRLRIKRAYEAPAPGDGSRILVDRLWPRGIKKENARIDVWLKDIAPSAALRKWFGHDPEKWAEFKRRYKEELSLPAAREGIKTLRSLAAGKPVTLVYAASDKAHNNALALSEFLEKGGLPKGKATADAATKDPRAGKRVGKSSASE